MINWKIINYSWNTDPIVAAWKEACDETPSDTLPTRVKIGGEWHTTRGITRNNKPEDVRSDEQKVNDRYVHWVKFADSMSEKKLLNEVRLVKKDIRTLGKRIYDHENGKPSGIDYGNFEHNARRLEYYEQCGGTRFSEGIYWHDLIDYVNQRFGLEIHKDILTDKEREKAKLVIDMKKFDEEKFAKALARNHQV